MVIEVKLRTFNPGSFKDQDKDKAKCVGKETMQISLVYNYGEQQSILMYL